MPSKTIQKFRTAYSENNSWLGTEQKEIKLATYQGKYLAICRDCCYAKVNKHNQKDKKLLVQLEPKNIENFKLKHEDHNWTLIHISRTANYIQKQMIGGKICQVIL